MFLAYAITYTSATCILQPKYTNVSVWDNMDIAEQEAVTQ